jgi:hypothetical protein
MTKNTASGFYTIFKLTILSLNQLNQNYILTTKVVSMLYFILNVSTYLHTYTVYTLTDIISKDSIVIISLI